MDSVSRLNGLDVVSGPAWGGVSYFCSTRQGGVSQGPWASLNVGQHTDDDPAHVVENRRRLAPTAGPIVWLNQVHGTDVHDVDGSSAVAPTDAVRADALVTSRHDRVLAIMTADCLPVVLGSSDGQVIGVAHAGWRGLAAGVLENTLASLRDKYDGPRAPEWRAWIGPGISQACFEVGHDVRDVFIDSDPDTSVFFISAGQPGKWLADLSAVARHRLKKNGVGQVDVSSLCTYKRADLFYSYRRDGVTGRLVTLAWRTAVK